MNPCEMITDKLQEENLKPAQKLPYYTYNLKET